MSAPSALQQHEVAVTATVSAPSVSGYAGPERRSQDALSKLSRQFDELCARAVDADEIAAGLEAAGFSDSRVAEQFGRSDVFALADELFRLVPRRLTPIGGLGHKNPWRTKPSQLVIRGLIFALPGLLYVAISGVRGTMSGGVALVVGLMVGWSSSQGFAYLGHTLMGRRAVRAAHVLLRRGLLLGTVLTSAVAAAATALGLVTAAVAALACGQVLYMLAAAALLVVGGEMAIMLGLLPGVAAAVMVMADPTAVPPGVAALAVALSLGLMLGLAWGMTRGPRGNRISLRAQLARVDVVEAGWNAAYGLLCAALVCLPIAVHGTVSMAAIGLAVVPLVWSMGVAEWQVFRFRRVTHNLLRNVTTVDVFTRLARRAAARSIVIYLLVLLASSAAFFGGVRLLASGLANPQLVEALAIYDLIALALLIALVVNTCGGVRLVVTTMAVLLVGTAAVLAWTPSDLQAAAAMFLVLVLVLAVIARQLVGDATRHN